MQIKSKIKSGIKLIFGKRPTILTANIVKLAPSDLLKERVALITGGTSGIGYAIAEAMLDAGATVIITGRNEERCEEARERLLLKNQSRQNRVFYPILDNRNVPSFDNALTEILQKIGNKKISILVNNAGVQSVHFGETTEAEYDACLDTNLKGAYFLTQKVAKYMVNNQIKGNILNIASSSSLRPAANAYTISKVGLKEITAGIAKSLIPHGIIVNGIAPGPTATPMLIKSPNPNLAISHNPLGRYALPEEIANMAVILTSDMGRTIVGSLVFMTGGGGITTFDDVNYPF